MTRSALLILMPKPSAYRGVALAFFHLATLDSFSGFSSTTSLAGLSSRSAMKLGWRRMPSEVNSV